MNPCRSADLGAEAARWPRFVPAALDAGFASVHAVPMRAAGNVLGALGLFGTRPGRLSDADRLVAQTLAHIACVAILQEHAPTPSTVMPQLRSVLTSRVVVDQAKGFLREVFDVSVEDAFTLLRSYAARQRGSPDRCRPSADDRSAFASSADRRHRRIRQGAKRLGACLARARRTASSTSRSATTTSLTFSLWLIRFSRSTASSAVAPVRLRTIPIA